MDLCLGGCRDLEELDLVIAHRHARATVNYSKTGDAIHDGHVVSPALSAHSLLIATLIFAESQEMD